MTDVPVPTVPPAFRTIASLLLLWEALGCALYLVTTTTGADEATPVWATAAFGIATWGGLLGAIALLMRRRWATPLLALSLAAILVRTFYFLQLDAALTAPEWGITLVIVGIGVFAVWYSWRAGRRGWLR